MNAWLLCLGGSALMQWGCGSAALGAWLRDEMGLG